MTENQKAQEKEALVIQTRSQTLQIKDAETLQEANDITIHIKVRRDQARNIFKPMKDKARESVQEIQNQWDKIDVPLREAEATFKRNISVYFREQQEIRRKAQLEVDRLEREERLKKIREEEKLEEEKKKKAKAAIKAGDLDKANKIMSEPIEEVESETSLPDPSFVPPPTALNKGSSIKKNYKFEVMDEKKVPNQFRSIDLVKIGKYVRAMKDDAMIPGVRVWSEDSVSIRTDQ